VADVAKWPICGSFPKGMLGLNRLDGMPLSVVATAAAVHAVDVQDSTLCNGGHHHSCSGDGAGCIVMLTLSSGVYLQ
jgi:hypothetical protein